LIVYRLIVDMLDIFETITTNRNASDTATRRRKKDIIEFVESSREKGDAIQYPVFIYQF
jgi:molybdenum cofactor biosynthesis enzyme